MATSTDKKETKTEVQAVKAPYESKYGIDELAAAAKTAFDTSAIMVRAALKTAGKTEYTMAEAKTIVDKFKNKEVKA